MTLAGAKRPRSSRSNAAEQPRLRRGHSRLGDARWAGCRFPRAGGNSNGGKRRARPVRRKIFAFLSTTAKWSRNSPMLSDDPRNSSPSGFSA